MLPTRVAVLVVVMVTVGWIASLTASIFSPHYRPPEGLNGAMTLVVGGAVAAVFTRKGGDGPNGGGK